MKRNILLASLLAGVIIISSATFGSQAQALSVDELQAQIKELLAKLADLRAQLAVQTQATTTASIAVSESAPHRICAILQRNLSRGTTGDDVVGLQEFLRDGGYFYANATGYFGPATAQAVAKWQAAEGLSSVGIFGPMSRERIKIWCGGWGKERFSATPQRGEAPLAVVFDTWLSGFRPQSIYYMIDFGDGTSERAADCPAPADACTAPGQNKHTYTQNGSYTATLNKITDPCPDDGNPNTPRCLAPIQSEVVAKLQIHVGPVACTKEYMPVCGAKPIVCITTPCDPVPTTYGNRCMMQADGARYLYDGVCRDTSGNRPPTISSFSGPTTLSVDQTGTWTIQASDPENGTLSYRITWGDEYVSAPTMSAGATQEFTQTATFTHSYARAGTYTIIVVVRDSQGLEAKTSTTVRIGAEQVACTMEYAPVCGRPTGCANTCPPGMYCTAICRLHDPVTYGNRCMLSASGAEFLYEGQCR